MPDVLWPLFCTADIPLSILNELLKISRAEDPEHRDVLRILGPDSIGPTAPDDADTDSATVPPISSQPSENFSDWSISDIYAFWKQYVRARDDIIDNRYTAFTFLIADATTTQDRTVLVCSDAPDWGESDDAIVLKEVRMGFKDAATDMASFEYLSMAPSEFGKGKGLLVNPNPWMKVVGYLENGQEVMKFSTPAFARSRKRQALVDASIHGTIDMTRTEEEPHPDGPRRFYNLDEALGD